MSFRIEKPNEYGYYRIDKPHEYRYPIVKELDKDIQDRHGLRFLLLTDNLFYI